MSGGLGMGMGVDRGSTTGVRREQSQYQYSVIGPVPRHLLLRPVSEWDRVEAHGSDSGTVEETEDPERPRTPGLVPPAETLPCDSVNRPGTRDTSDVSVTPGRGLS